MSDAHIEQADEQTTAQVEQRIVDALAKIREHWHELLDVPEGGSSGSPSTDTLTALERRLTLRQDVDRMLAGVCRLVIRDRPLTTVRLPIRDMGRLAASKLLPNASREATDGAATSIVVPHLTVRDSSRPPPR